MINIVNFEGTKIECFEDWALHGLPPSRRDKQWKEGRSAFELARSWTGRGACAVPSEIKLLLDSHDDISSAELIRGIVEHPTRLPFGTGGPRCHDLLVSAVLKNEPLLISIEAKSDETFGGTLSNELELSLRDAKKRKSGITRFPERLEWLVRLVLDSAAFLPNAEYLVEPSLSGLFYQLFSAVGGALLEARRQRAVGAVLIFHEFRTNLTDDKRMGLNADALNAFARIFFAANGFTGELIEGKIVGPICLRTRVLDLGIEMPIGIPLYLGKVKTDLLGQSTLSGSRRTNCLPA